MQSLIDTYKAQRAGGAIPVKTVTPAVNVPVYPDKVYNQPPANVYNQPLNNAVPRQVGGHLADPYARSNDVLNTPNDTSIVASGIISVRGNQSANRIVNPAADFRDPLSSVFQPDSRLVLDPHSIRGEMSFDSRLNDVCFVNAHYGWVVGDRGVIWHTNDGGKSWQQQSSPVNVSLQSVHFFNEQNGFAVGGYTIPYSHNGRGVVIVTTNGGKTWNWVASAANLPRLMRVRMLDNTKHTLLVGASSDNFPSGIIESNDGCQTWQPIAGKRNNGWYDISPINECTGSADNCLGIGFDRIVQRLYNVPSVERLPQLGLRRPLAIDTVVREIPGLGFTTTGFIVGEGGMILSTSNEQNWNQHPYPLPGKSADLFDLNTVCTVANYKHNDNRGGSTVYLAGSPGTKIYYSNDNGKTWNEAATGVTVPIRKIRFTDANNGWAVGDLGTILSTNDGGKTWTVQRRGGQRLAVLTILTDTKRLPFEPLAQLCGENGYLGGVITLTRNGTTASGTLPSSLRLHDAVLKLGVSCTEEAWQFPLEPREAMMSEAKVIEQLNRMYDGKGLEKLRSTLVKAIRQWQPDVILSTDATARNASGFDVLLQRELLAAVTDAADATKFPEQLTDAALEPCRVQKVHLALDENVVGDVNFKTQTIAFRLGELLTETAAKSRSIIENEKRRSPEHQSFTTPINNTGISEQHDLMSGVNITPGSGARRAMLSSQPANEDLIIALNQQKQRYAGIIGTVTAANVSDGQSPQNSRVNTLLRGIASNVDEDSAIELLFDMGKRCEQCGDWETAVQTYKQIIDEFPRHPLVSEAFVWLLRFYGSEEAGWITCPTDIIKNSVTQLKTDSKTGAVSANVTYQNLPALNGGNDGHNLRRIDQTLMYGTIIAQSFPSVYQDPRVQFANAAALRSRGFTVEADAYYNRRGRNPNDDVWSMRARTEHWLLAPDKPQLPPEQRDCPIPAIACIPIDLRQNSRPYLDGLFDDDKDKSVWSQSKLYSFTVPKTRDRLVELLRVGVASNIDKIETSGRKYRNEQINKSQNFGTKVMLMYDNEFLYVGLRCKRVAGYSYVPQNGKPRQRDTDMSNQDRVEIMLDIDRDYSSAYKFTIDYRGWVNDSCMNDTSWNPDIFVANASDGESWLIEAAIPLSALTKKTLKPNETWAIAIRRLVPNNGIECWNAENSFDLEEGFGLLIFQ
ncbi:MAG: hypothetical protein LBU65_14200 [Planctomycetaceae bacterium]|nr:hypothetical protein [Planctomycetaceae bacterium]